MFTPKIPSAPPLPKLPAGGFPLLPELPFPPLPPVPAGSKAKALPTSNASKSRPAQLTGDGVKHAREKGGSRMGLASHRRLKDRVRSGGDQADKSTTTSVQGAGFSPDASLAALPKSPKMRLIESPKTPQSPFKADNKFVSHARTSGKSVPKMASLDNTSGSIPKLNAFSNFRTNFSSEPAVQLAAPRKKTRKPADPRVLKKENARKLVAEKIKPSAARVAQLPLPASRLDEEKLQNEAIRKKLVPFELWKAFGDDLPVKDAKFDDQGRVCAIQVQRKYFDTSKWIAIEWKDDTPSLKDKVWRLHDVTSKSLKNKLDVIAENIAIYDKSVVIEPSAKRDLCLQRAINAIETASALLPDLPNDAGSTFLRMGFQGMTYTVSNSVGFKDAYTSSQLSTYFEGMGKEDLLKHVDALLVEAFKDVRQVVAGCVSPDQIIELIKLFPENPSKTDKRNWAEVDEENKKLIQSKLKEMLGEYYPLVGGLFRLVSTFQELAVSVLKDDSLIGLAKNFWRTNMLLFGLASQQVDMAYGENGTPEAREFGSRKLMWAFHLSNNAADYFDLDA